MKNRVSPAKLDHDQDTTVTNIVNTYMYPRSPPVFPFTDSEDEGDDEGGLEFEMVSRPASSELGRAPPHTSLNNQDEAFQVRPGVDNVGKHNRHNASLYGNEGSTQMAPSSSPPSHVLPAYMPPMYTAQGQLYCYSDCAELPSSTDQTYGNTGQLLHLTPCREEPVYPPYPAPSDSLHSKRGQRHSPYGFASNNPYNRFSFLSNEDDSVHGPKRKHQHQPTVPPTWSGCDLPARSRTETMTSIAQHAGLPLSTTMHSSDRGSWATVRPSLDDANVARLERCPAPEPGQLRASEDSYANTSDYGSDQASLVNLQQAPPPRARGRPNQAPSSVVVEERAVAIL